MLGPPVCNKCMRVLDFYPNADAPSRDRGGHHYWYCTGCGMDCNDEGCGHLFLYSNEELDIILKDNPKMRRIMREMRTPK